MPNHISMIGTVTTKYAVVTPRKLLFDGDGPSFYEEFVTGVGDARAKASQLPNSKIYRYEIVEVEGFSGVLTKSKEVAK